MKQHIEKEPGKIVPILEIFFRIAVINMHNTRITKKHGRLNGLPKLFPFSFLVVNKNVPNDSENRTNRQENSTSQIKIGAISIGDLVKEPGFKNIENPG